MAGGNLPALLWGGLFGSLALYLAAARAWTLGRVRVRGVWRGGDRTLAWEGPPPAPAPALFVWTLTAEGRHSPGRPFRVEVSWPGGSSAAGADLPGPQARGDYRVTLGWELRDVFGWTRGRAVVVGEERVWVPTAPWSGPQSPPPPQDQGPRRSLRVGRRDGDPFDVRPYLAGDDLRRLHWPLFAHAGTPFVRVAEASPPPTGRPFFVVDTTAVSEEDLDPRLGLLAGWIGDLEARGVGWTAAVPAWGLTLGPGPGWPRQLAGLSPRPWPEGFRPERWPSSVILITGSPGTRPALGPRRRVQTVAVPGEVPRPPQTRPWWRRP